MVYKVTSISMDQKGNVRKSSALKGGLVYEVVECFEDGTELWYAEFRSGSTASVFASLLNNLRVSRLPVAEGRSTYEVHGRT